MKKIILGLALLILVNTGLLPSTSLVSAQGQGGSDAPYLYYYSGTAHAWVIERADGTDRRLFGQGILPPELNTALQVEWSPSGKWLSWFGYNNCTLPGSYGGCHEDFQWQLLGTGHQPRLTSLNGRTIYSPGSLPPSVSPFDWSPTNDLLLVNEHRHYADRAGLDDALADPIAKVRYAVLDATTDQVLWEFERNFSTPITYFSAMWLNDGQSVLFHYGFDDRDTQPNYFVLIRPDGQKIERTIFAKRLSVSPNGIAAYKRGSDLWLTNLITGQIRRIALGGLEDIPFTLQLDATGDGALIWVKEPYETTGALWWLDVNSGHFVPIIENLKGYSVAPSIRFIYAIDENQNAYYFDVLTKQVVFLMLVHDGINLDWKPDDQLLVWATDYEDYIETGLLYNFQTGHVTSLPAPTPTGGSCHNAAYLSNDSRYLAWVDIGPIVYDTTTGQKVQLREDARGFMSSRGAYVEWHPQQNWFLTFDEGLVAGGGCGPIYNGVASADGSVQRDIYSYYVEWLPDQINPEVFPLDSAPALPEPVMTLKGTDYSMILEWSPDGKLLAADNNGEASGLKYAINVWDVASGTVNIQMGSEYGYFTFTPNIRQLEWKYLPSGVFVPIGFQEIPPSRFPSWNDMKIYATNSDQNLMLVQEGWQKFHIYNRALSRIEIIMPESRFLTKGQFSPDGRLFASTAYYLNTLRIWDTITWEILAEIEIAGLSLAFSPDSQYLAVGVSWDVEIWRVSDLIQSAETE